MAKKGRKTGFYMALRHRETGRNAGHAVVEVLRPQEVLRLVKQADERKKARRTLRVPA